VLNDVAHRVEHILGAEFQQRGYDPKLAELYSQALVGMVALVGRWWLDVRKPRKATVAAHLVNLAWSGLSHLEPNPVLQARRRTSESWADRNSSGVGLAGRLTAGKLASPAVQAVRTFGELFPSDPAVPELLLLLRVLLGAGLGVQADQ